MFSRCPVTLKQFENAQDAKFWKLLTWENMLGVFCSPDVKSFAFFFLS